MSLTLLEQARNYMTHWDQFWSQAEDRDWWESPTTEILDLLASLSPAHSPRVLDLGCGLGRHSIAFTQAGFSVTSIDSSITAVKFLQAWSQQLGFDIQILLGDFLNPCFRREHFDLVLSYNVLYHGFREQFALAIQHVYSVLKPAGLFFFTCPTRQDGKYGHGQEIKPHTYISTKSVVPGDIHYFSDEVDLDILLNGFRLLSRVKDEGYFLNQGTQQFFSNWQVLAQKEG
jgi:tellurite methyltransferase